MAFYTYGYVVYLRPFQQRTVSSNPGAHLGISEFIWKIVYKFTMRFSMKAYMVKKPAYNLIMQTI